MANIREEVLEIISTVTEKEPKSISPDAHLIQDIGADSMNALEILAALEKKYRIVLPEEKLKEMTTLNRIISFVEEAMKKK